MLMARVRRVERRISLVGAVVVCGSVCVPMSGNDQLLVSSFESLDLLPVIVDYLTSRALEGATNTRSTLQGLTLKLGAGPQTREPGRKTCRFHAGVPRVLRYWTSTLLGRAESDAFPSRWRRWKWLSSSWLCLNLTIIATGSMGHEERACGSEAGKEGTGTARYDTIAEQGLMYVRHASLNCVFRIRLSRTSRISLTRFCERVSGPRIHVVTDGSEQGLLRYPLTAPVDRRDPALHWQLYPTMMSSGRSSEVIS